MLHFAGDLPPRDSESPPDEPPTTGVREPRKPIPPDLAGAIALELPSE